MFYSHQLLARKAPLGQIWMAATMHAKINRKKLSKLNIIKICEEILNPSVPMALRLSGILMGGVVIVYERKVKLLYDDVSRLLVEINEAWKVRTVPDPTVLPKGKTQARYEAVTLPDHGDVEIEHSMSFSMAAEGFPRKGFRMQLDDLDDQYININLGDDGASQKYHQADPANITLDELDSMYQQDDLYKLFERFDIDGDDEAQISITPMDERAEVPSTLVPSPPPPDPPGDGIRDHLMEELEQHQAENQQPGRRGNESPVSEEDVQGRQPAKRKERKFSRLAMDIGLLIIPADFYQSWLQDTSDIIAKRPRLIRLPVHSAVINLLMQQHNPMRHTRISDLMELPPVALISGFDNATGQIHYPEPLLELWRRSSQLRPDNDKPSEGGLPRRPRAPPAYSRTEGLHPQDVASEGFGSEADSRTMEASIEKLRANLENMDFQGVGDTLATDAFVTPGSPARSAHSAPSSGSGHPFLPPESEILLPSGRSKRRQLSSSNKSLGNLDPVEEDAPFEQNKRDFKLRRVSEKGPTADFDLNNTELLEETAPAQTPNLVILDPTVDKVTQSIRTHLKLHFDTPGAPELESLNLLAAGMNKKRAAQLFYQTCVLATCDFVKVQQTAPYGDISISRGSKM